MTPFDSTVHLYGSRPDMNLWDDIYLHRKHGYVIMTPEVHIMARPVCKDWDTHLFRRIYCVADEEKADCWFIWLLAGSLKAAVKHLPYSLPWFGFSQRGQPPRFMEAEKVLARIR